MRTILLLSLALVFSQLRADTFEKLPIDSLYKVTNPSGEVFYLSGDRRFVLRGGTLYDLRNGNDVASDLFVTNEVDLSRNGISVERMSFSTGVSAGNQTLFVAPGCVECGDAAKLATTVFPGDLNIVLLGASKRELEINRQIWCAENPMRSLSTWYEKRSIPGAAKVASECDTLGLMVADQAAKLFGIGALPFFVTAENEGITGLVPLMTYLKGVEDGS